MTDPTPTPTPAIIAGIGFRHACPARDIVLLVQLAAANAGVAPTALAAPAFKRHEPGLHAAAHTLALPLLLVDGAALASVQAHCLTGSAVAQREVGIASVAEGCALAAAGPGARLLQARITGARATCAIAAGASAGLP